MNIDRNVEQWNLEQAVDMVDFCLNHLEKLPEDDLEVIFRTRIGPRLTVEEITGALIAAEQQLKLMKEEQ